MAHATAQQMAPALPKEKQITQARAALSQISKDTEAAKKEFDAYQVDAEKHTELKKKIDAAQAEHDTLLNSTGDLTTKHKNLTERVGALVAQVKEADNKLAVLTDSHDTLKKKHTKLLSDVERTEKTSKETIAKTTKATDIEVGEVSSKLTSAHAELSNVKNAIDDAKTVLTAHKQRAKQHADLLDEVAAAQTVLENVKAATEKCVAATANAKVELATTDDKIAKKWDQFEGAMKQKEDAHTARIQAHESKESNLSQREGFLKDAKKELRDVKVALEKVHGKPLNHIVIPD